MTQPKPVYLIAPTAAGRKLAQAIEALLPEAVLWERPLGALDSAWREAGQLVFVLAVGAVVRLIAPLLADKRTDPGVVVMDEAGRFAVSLSAGHIGGADALAERIAALLSATAVLTGAGGRHGLPPVDLLGKAYGWRAGEACDWNRVAALAAAGEPVQVVQECGLDLWRTALPEGHPFVATAAAAGRLWISHRLPAADTLPTVRWHPRVIWLGVGCERGIAADFLEQSIRQALAGAGLAFEAVAGLASLDIKADEAALLAVAERHGWPVRFFDAATLARCPVPNPSEAVADCVGTPSVAEAAALLAGEALQLAAPKRVFKATAAGACTVAAAVALEEFNPAPGRLLLIGSGPGALDQITPAARAALAAAQVVIGYQLYIDLIRPLLAPTQIVETSPITQEVARAERAIALARRGLAVAVISSGDAGIYGMAGLVFERLARGGWDGQAPAVDVLPGITAVQAAAARVGAPLMHDFCAISLSDLLTPWQMICTRLEAAARADFVVALYNPRSASRTWQIAQAREILLAHRDPATPVALVRCAYRPDEQVSLHTLADLPLESVDMLTTVLIGNRATFRRGDRLITPRGYPHP